MTIQVGDKIPVVAFKHKGKNGPIDVQNVSTDDICKGKKVVMFGLPGAYTPVCSAEHLPGFVKDAEKIKAMGVDTVACISANDPFVMEAWADSLNANDSILMLSDHSSEFTNAIGLSLDLSDLGLGNRSERYSMIVDDGVITALQVEESILSCDASSSDALLSKLSH